MPTTGLGSKGVLAGTDNNAGNDCNEHNEPAVCERWPTMAVQPIRRQHRSKRAPLYPNRFAPGASHLQYVSGAWHNCRCWEVAPVV